MPAAILKKKWQLKYSLRSLLLFTLTLASLPWLWQHRKPWVLERSLNIGPEFPKPENPTSPFPSMFESISSWCRAEFSPDRKRILAGTLADPTDPPSLGMDIWSPSTYAEEALGSVYDLTDGRTLLRSAHDLWRFSEGGAWVHRFDGPFGRPSMVHIDSGKILAESDDMTEKPEDKKGAEFGRPFLRGRQGGPTLSESERRTVYYDKKGYYVICDPLTEQTYKRLAATPGKQSIVGRFSNTERYLATQDGHSTGPVIIWDLATGERKFEWSKQYGKVEFSADDSKALFHAEQQNLHRLFDLNTEKTIATLDKEEDAGPFSADGRYLMVRKRLQLNAKQEAAPALKKNRVRIMDADNGQTLVTFDIRGYAAKFAPDSSKVCVFNMTGSEYNGEGEMDIHDAHNGACLWTLDQSLLLALGKERALLRGAEDATDVAKVVLLSTGETLATLEGPNSRMHEDQKPAILAAVFADNDDRILIARMDRTVQTWGRRRPEPWWGIFWLEQAWLALAFGVGLVWSLWHERRICRKQALARTKAQPSP